MLFSCQKKEEEELLFFFPMLFGFAKVQMWCGRILGEVDKRYSNGDVDDTHVDDKELCYVLPPSYKSSVSNVQHAHCADACTWFCGNPSEKSTGIELLII